MSLVARHLEANGLPTLCLGSAADILRAGRPPRAVVLDFPLGHSAGVPFDLASQRAVLQAALAAFERAEPPEAFVPLPFAWPFGSRWREEARNPAAGDQRQSRDTTPRYQTEADRLLAEAG